MADARICLITGANSGIGRITALELAKKGFDIIMLCRNLDKSQPVRDEIEQVSKTKQVDLIRCDLADFDSVRQAAREVNDRYDHLDVLVNNAGLFIDKEKRSPQGIELTFATNHLGPFLLTNLLLDRLRKGTDARVVTVSSAAHRFTGMGGFKLDELAQPASYSAWGAYGSSKLANILFAKELSDRLMDDGITSNSLHPGAVATNFGSGGGWVSVMTQVARPFFISAEEGAETSIYLASSPAVEHVTGLYFDKKKPVTPSSDARSNYNAKRLWAISEELTQLKQPVAEA